MIMLFFIVVVLLAVVLITAYLIADNLGFVPHVMPVTADPEYRRCDGCGRTYHKSWEEPEPVRGEEDLRGLGPCCTGAD